MTVQLAQGHIGWLYSQEAQQGMKLPTSDLTFPVSEISFEYCIKEDKELTESICKLIIEALKVVLLHIQVYCQVFILKLARGAKSRKGCCRKNKGSLRVPTHV